MRIIIASNAPFCHTGYGTQTAFVIKTLQDLGHDMAVMSHYGLEGAKLDMGGVPIYPPGRGDTPSDIWGTKIITAHIHDFRADLVISLHDLWPMPTEFAERVTVPWVGWFPVDHYPAPPKVVYWAGLCDYPLTYSGWGQDVMQEAGVVNCGYMPLGVNTEVFTPGSMGEARERLHWDPDRFIVAMVAANKGDRKAYPEQIDAFARFAAERPELNPQLYIHCDYMRRGGFNLPVLAEELGITDRVVYVNRYRYELGLPETYLADVYRAANVLLGAVRAEGFGLPLIEAQACGCPVITTGFSSMPEVTFNGECVPPLTRIWTPMDAWMAWPSVEGITEALHRIADRSADDTAREVQEGRKQVINRYGSEMIRFHWARFLQRVENDGHTATAG